MMNNILGDDNNNYENEKVSLVIIEMFIRICSGLHLQKYNCSGLVESDNNNNNK